MTLLAMESESEFSFETYSLLIQRGKSDATCFNEFALESAYDDLRS